MGSGMNDSALQGGGSQSPQEKSGRSCPKGIALISWSLILQGIGLLALLVMLVVCACEHYEEIADEFSGLVTLLLLGAIFVLFMGLKLRQGSAWTRAMLLWVLPLPILDGFIKGTYAPPLLLLLAAQYVIYFYILTKPNVLACFRTHR
jgi:hypothetical protein